MPTHLTATRTVADMRAASAMGDMVVEDQVVMVILPGPAAINAAPQIIRVMHLLRLLVIKAIGVAVALRQILVKQVHNIITTILIVEAAHAHLRHPAHTAVREPVIRDIPV
jgi:hypothetical protein